MTSRLLRVALAMGLAAAVLGCRGRQTVKVGWDVPSPPPDHYRLFMDGREIKSFPPPPVDRSCECMMIEVPTDGAAHTIRLEACDTGSTCTTSAEVRTP